MSEVFQLSGILKIVFPVERGNIEDFNAYEKLLHTVIYSNLKIDPSDYGLLLIVDPIVPIKMYYKLFELCFEIFNFPRVIILNSFHILQLYLGKKMTGIYGNIGDRISYFQAYSEGTPQSNLISDHFGLSDVINYFKRLLRKNGKGEQSRFLKLPFFESIAKNHLFCSLNPKELLENMTRELFLTKSVKTPDGDNLLLQEELYLAPELLFDFKHMAIDEDDHFNSLQSMIAKILEDLDDKSVYLDNIVIFGGGASIKNFPYRLEIELDRILPDYTLHQINIRIPPRPVNYIHKIICTQFNELFNSDIIKNRLITKKLYSDGATQSDAFLSNIKINY
ncbi:MAG: hypothetical protein BAJALOKI1v1_1450003 [Promethearchaeota archaeon]|nr:MAG: hypothetical protein BAJALOKI1v1_1450003 [Candidatus Lokiarchaeota archaeon]